MRARAFAAILAAAAFWGPSDADQVISGKSVEFVVPSASPVRFKAMAQYDVANFDGEFVITARYRYGYLTNDPERDAKYGTLELKFEPEPTFAKQLPYVKSYGPVKELFFENPDDFIKAAIPASELKRLKERALYSISGTATVRLDRYKAWDECGAPYYYVHFLALERPPQIQVSQNVEEEDGC